MPNARSRPGAHHPGAGAYHDGRNFRKGHGGGGGGFFSLVRSGSVNSVNSVKHLVKLFELKLVRGSEAGLGE